MRGWRFLLGLIVLLGCEAQGPSPSPDKSPDQASGHRSYSLRGVVRSVDVAGSEVTIRHEAIPGFMASMTMPFRLDDAELLADLRPGDEVEGRLEVELEGDKARSYRLEGLAITMPATAPPDAPGPALPVLLAVGDEVPDFRVTTQDGEPRSLSDDRGKSVVLTFIYTRCPLPDFCPLIDRKFAELATRIGRDAELADSVRLLSVSFDPEYDTPEVLTRHARRNGAKAPLWTYASASHEELARIAPGLGLTYGPGGDEVLHNLVTAVIDPEGKLLALERGRDWLPAAVVRKLRARVER